MLLLPGDSSVYAWSSESALMVPDGDFTLSAWILGSALSPSTSTTGQVFAAWGSTTASDEYATLRTGRSSATNGAIFHTARNSGSHYIERGIGIAEDNHYHHVVLQRSGDDLTVTVDGVIYTVRNSVTSNDELALDITGFNYANIDRFCVGGLLRSSFVAGSAKMWIGEVGLWDRALSSSEISQLFGQACPTRGEPSNIGTNLVAYWPLKTDLGDDSGNGYDLTASGTPSYDSTAESTLFGYRTTYDGLTAVNVGATAEAVDTSPGANSAMLKITTPAVQTIAAPSFMLSNENRDVWGRIGSPGLPVRGRSKAHVNQLSSKYANHLRGLCETQPPWVDADEIFRDSMTLDASTTYPVIFVTDHPVEATAVAKHGRAAEASLDAVACAATDDGCPGRQAFHCNRTVLVNSNGDRVTMTRSKLGEGDGYIRVGSNAPVRVYDGDTTYDADEDVYHFGYGIIEASDNTGIIIFTVDHVSALRVAFAPYDGGGNVTAPTTWYNLASSGCTYLFIAGVCTSGDLHVITRYDPGSGTESITRISIPESKVIAGTLSVPADVTTDVAAQVTGRRLYPEAVTMDGDRFAVAINLRNGTSWESISAIVYDAGTDLWYNPVKTVTSGASLGTDGSPRITAAELEAVVASTGCTVVSAGVNFNYATGAHFDFTHWASAGLNGIISYSTHDAGQNAYGTSTHEWAIIEQGVVGTTAAGDFTGYDPGDATTYRNSTAFLSVGATLYALTGDLAATEPATDGNGDKTLYYRQGPQRSDGGAWRMLRITDPYDESGVSFSPGSSVPVGSWARGSMLAVPVFNSDQFAVQSYSIPMHEYLGLASYSLAVSTGGYGYYYANVVVD